MLLAWVMGATTPGIAAAPFDPRSLVEVRTLKGLPGDLVGLLGGETSGPAGIADAGEPFNRTDVEARRLPMRRFIVAGSNLRFVLVAYEQGGRGYSIRARGYALENTGWKQVEEWTLAESPSTLRALTSTLFPPTTNGRSVPDILRFQERVRRTMPRRRDAPLRAENISDNEVREIQAVAHGVVPDTLVNISGVVTGCPCEEGQGCSDQVWIVAYSPGQMKGLQLSRINGRWTLGPVQQWWLDLERIDDRRERFASWTEYLTARRQLYDKFPSCSAGTASP